MTVAYLLQKALLLSLYLAGPLVAATVVIGLVIGFLQSALQLQEQALPFGIKLFVIIVMTALLGHWMTGQLLAFLVEIFDQMPWLGKGN